MREFYERLWVRGESKLEALRGAQLSFLSRNRATTGEGLPAIWGAFVFEGDIR